MKITLRPAALRVEATSSCQLRCPACPTATGATRPVLGRGFLRAEDLARLLDANPQVRAVELSNYGEMFLNPEFVDLLRVCHERRVTATGANGANLNNARPEMLEAVVRYGMREITVSIDGASQESYAAYRVGGRFDTVIANIVRINAHKRRLKSEFPRLRWQFVIFGHNQDEIETAREMAGTLGMDFLPKLSWNDDVSPLRDPEAVRRVIPQGVANRDEFRERTGKDYAHGICDQLWDSPQVNWDGKLVGCCRNFWGEFGANVFAEGLIPAVNGERMSHARDMLRGRAEPRADVPCATCEIYLDMRATGRFMSRDDVARGQGFSLPEALHLARLWATSGRKADADRMCRSILAADPANAIALALLAGREVSAAEV